MSKQHQVFELIRSLTGQSNILTIPREFITYTGDIESALLLSQLIYWSDRTKNPEGYIYKTYKEWEEEITLNEYQVRKAKTKLEKKGILETKIKKANGNPTVHYRIDTEKFTVSFLQNLKEPNFKNSSIETLNFKESLTEITTEITPEITYKKEYEEEAACTIDLDFKNVMRTYTDNINALITPIEAMSLQEWSEKLEPDLIVEAIKEAVKHKARSFKYIEKILINWHQQGIKTVKEYESYLRDKGEKHGTNTSKPRCEDDGIGISL